ncbi:MAG: sulfatase-like hydrolase/transferase [Promethearchaeota archaeon]
MDIFWIVTDSICNYERSDLHGLLPIYKKLKKNKEGFYFEDALSQFPSTNLSLLSFLTGRFPYYIFPDYYRSIENIPSLEYENCIFPLKKENYNIQSIIFGREQVEIVKEILNPVYIKELYQGDHWLDADEIYHIFMETIKESPSNENNFFFVFFRPSDTQVDFYVNKIIDYLKENGFWDNAIFILNSDHGYYDKNLYKKTKLLHFDDIHQSSMQPALFIKLPSSLTDSPPKTIKSRVYLLDIIDTILDYLNLKANHDRESISFKELIEKDINVNKNRIIRGDCYLMFQSIKKTMITKNNWKLRNDNGKFSLFNLNKDPLEKKDIKENYPEIYNELYHFYLKTELKAYEIIKSTLNTLYSKSILPSIESETILIPKQFPSQLIKFLKENLQRKNKIVELSDVSNSVLSKNKDITTVLIYNRLTGYGLKKLYKKYQRYSKKFTILDTQLNELSNQLNKTGYLKFVMRSIIARRNQLFQRWKEIVVWILYFPLYFNKYVRKYYN